MATPKLQKISKEVRKKSELMFGSMATMMSGTLINKLQKENVWRLLTITAKAFDVPPQGITILGDQPYLNKVALNYKLAQYFPKVRISHEYLHLATPSEPYAIVKSMAHDEDGSVVAEEIGEAAPNNVKLDAVKTMLNQMAMTRSSNRVIWRVIVSNLFNEMNANLSKMKSKKEATEEDVKAISEGAKTTAEEMEQQAPVYKKSGFELTMAEIERDSKNTIKVIEGMITTTKEFSDKEKELLLAKIEEKKKQ